MAYSSLEGLEGDRRIEDRRDRTSKEEQREDQRGSKGSRIKGIKGSKSQELEAGTRSATVRRGRLFVTTPEKSLELIEEGKRNILIDLFFCQPGFHGGGEYGKAVFRKLIESYEAQHGVQLWVAADPRQHIDGWVWELCEHYGCPVIHVVVSHRQDGTFC